MGYNKDIVIHICGKGTHFCFFFQTFLSFSFHKVRKNVCTYRYLAKFHEKTSIIESSRRIALSSRRGRKAAEV